MSDTSVIALVKFLPLGSYGMQSLRTGTCSGLYGTKTTFEPTSIVPIFAFILSGVTVWLGFDDDWKKERTIRLDLGLDQYICACLQTGFLRTSM